MNLSGNAISAVTLLIGVFCGGCTSTDVRVSDSHTVDNARAHQILARVPGFDLSQVWFATGEEYWSSGTCLDGRNIEAFTKPQLSSQGIWRGKILYVDQPTLDSKSKCADPDAFRYDPKFFIATVTYIEPDRLNMEEAWDGAEPGLFEVRGDITDDELRNVAVVIKQVDACLAKQATCPYPVTHDSRMNWSDHDLVTAVKTENLLTLSIANDFETGKPCYSMVFETGHGGAFGMDICYRNEAVSKVDVGGMVIE